MYVYTCARLYISAGVQPLQVDLVGSSSARKASPGPGLAESLRGEMVERGAFKMKKRGELKRREEPERRSQKILSSPITGDK